jgi:hypothetical protein
LISPQRHRLCGARRLLTWPIWKAAEQARTVRWEAVLLLGSDEVALAGPRGEQFA